MIVSNARGGRRLGNTVLSVSQWAGRRMATDELRVTGDAYGILLDWATPPH